MKMEAEVRSALDDLGYLRVERFTHRAVWSSLDVEHFLYLSRYGAFKEYLAIDFGIRNSGAQKYAIECVRSYGGEIYQLLNFDMEFDCSMRFSLGKLAGWLPRNSLYVAEMSNHSLANAIDKAVKQRLLPVIRDVRSLNSLFDILRQDLEPCRWLYVNGAIRAAQIAHIGRQLEVPPDEIRSILRPYTNHIASQISKGISVFEYIESVVD